MSPTVRRVAFFGFFAAVFISAVSAFAQYDEGNIDKSQAGKKNDVLTALRSGAGLGDGNSVVKTYLRKFFFPRWTAAANAAELINYRNRELPELLDAATGQARTELLEECKTLLAYMASSKKNYYPACRFNAMYALGSLNLQEGQPPVPYTPAVAELLKGYQDKTYPDGVRLAALEGLQRHAMLGIPDDSLRDEQVVPLLTQIALDTPYHEGDTTEKPGDTALEIVVEQKEGFSKTSEPQRSAEIQDWYRMRAIQGLGAMKGTKVAGKIAGTLLTIIENKVENPVIKYEAAFALGQLEIKEGDVPLPRASKTLVELGIVVCDDSLAFMEEQLRLQQVMSSAGGMSGVGGGMTGDGGMGSTMGGPSSGMSGDFGGMTGISTMSDAQRTQINNSLQRVKYGFSSIAVSIGGQKGNTKGLLPISEKDQIVKGMLENTQTYIAACIKFLDEGDPEKAKQLAQARRAAEAMSAGGGTRMRGTDGASGRETAAPKPSANDPKVTMREIEDQLKAVKGKFRVLIDSPTQIAPAAPAAAPAVNTSAAN
ncbi:MAG: hypothetical protein LBQ54_00580 [Planctomycetaceae bacterium]|jgi:hypothetical protein|nr:hypothetical protein [Planctomycetaceae bacterium]